MENLPLKRFRYSAVSLEAAISDVRKGISINQASKTHDVPWSTLKAKIKRKENGLFIFLYFLLSI